MADTSENLALPYLVGGQAQKHITHNEALRMLDALVQLTAISRSLSTPPASPAAGARYIVGSSPVGDWAGKASQIAAFQHGGWCFYPAAHGWLCHVLDEDVTLRFSPTGWVVPQGASAVSRLGINATADNTNRLALASAASLFNHAGNDHRLTINKAGVADTASVIFSVGFSGRVEMGLAGGGAFVIKVSANGTSWIEAMRINPSTGQVSFPAGVV